MGMGYFFPFTASEFKITHKLVFKYLSYMADVTLIMFSFVVFDLLCLARISERRDNGLNLQRFNVEHQEFSAGMIPHKFNLLLIQLKGKRHNEAIFIK